MNKILMPVKKVLAIFFGVFFMMMTVGQKVNPIEPLDKENVRLNLTLFSDIHMEGNVLRKFDSVPKCFNSLNGGKEYIDGLVIVGDNTMCAQNIENMFFYGILNNINPISTCYIATGNHDIGNDDEDFGTFEELRERHLGYVRSFTDSDITELYYSRILNGYYLIFMGPDTAECLTRNLSDEQLDWFEGQLDEAAKTGLPIFVFNHHPYSCIGQGYDRYVSLLNKYDNIFVVVGHTHGYFTGKGTVPGDKGTPEIIVPSLSEEYPEVGFGYQMEVYDSSIVFRGYNYYSGCFTGNDITLAVK